ncbi:MAG: COG4223 family protein [Alphaproteobacteria bacterium]
MANHSDKDDEDTGADDATATAGSEQALDAPEADAAPEEVPETAPAVGRRGRRALALALLVVVVLVAGAGYYAWPRLLAGLDGWLHARGVPVPAAAQVAALDERVNGLETAIARLRADRSGEDLARRLDALAARVETMTAALGRLDTVDALAKKVAALERRLAGLGARLDAAPGETTDGTALAARLDALEAALAERGQSPEVAAVRTRLAELAARERALDERLAALGRRVAAPGGARPALVLAVGQLRAALRGSGPYAAELEALKGLAGGDAVFAAPLAALDDRAAEGLPTLARLRARFKELAGAVVRAGYAPDQGSWADRTLARLARLVTVRRVGEVEGDSAEAIVARAETLLEARDLAAAVAEVEHLAGPPAEVAAAWLADARARLAADRALAAIETRVVATLGDS